jgi:hypothetical protein
LLSSLSDEDKLSRATIGSEGPLLNPTKDSCPEEHATKDLSSTPEKDKDFDPERPAEVEGSLFIPIKGI